jgi:hypothetical protein
MVKDWFGCGLRKIDQKSWLQKEFSQNKKIG